MAILESIIGLATFLPDLSRIVYYFSGTQTNFAKTKYYDIRAEFYRVKTEKSNSSSPASENLRKAEKNYSQQKAKHEQQLLKLEREKLSIEKQKLEFQQLELELQVEISAKRFDLLREFQQENVDLKWQEIQLKWDNNKNWPSTINRRDLADILRPYTNCLLIFTSEPEIGIEAKLDLFRKSEFRLEMRNLGDFLKHSDLYGDVSHPVKHFSEYFTEPIGDIQVEQLYSILNKFSTYVIHPDITTKKITFRIAFWGINGKLENLPPIEWNWQEAQKELIKKGKSEAESISDIRDSFVEIHKLITAFLINSYYLYVDPLYEFKFNSLEAELQLRLPQELINPFKELQEQQKTEYLNYLETLMEKPMSATQIRKQFAKYLADVVQTMQVAESEGLKEESAGQLSLADKIKKLKEKSAKLDSGIFNISLIGEFNRGKTTILNVLLGKSDFLPTSQVPTTALPTYIKYGEKEEATLFFSSEKDKLDFLKDKQNKKIKDKLIREGEKSITVDLDTYRDFFSFDSEFLSDLLDKFASWFKNNEQKDPLVAEEEARKKWLKGKEYFEITACVDLLREGVQFLDTAGLNDLDSINEKTKEQISNSDAILFILAADNLFDLTETQYLEEIKKNPRANIFYLINKWENIEDDEKEKQKVHNRSIKKFRDVFGLKTDDEAEKLWGERLFKIKSKNAKNKLLKGQNLDSTGFIEFEDRLDNYLKNEKLQEQILVPVISTEECVNECCRLISERLQTMKLDIDGLNEVIEKTDEPLTEIENNCSNIKKIIDSAIKSYNGNVILSYRDVFRETKTKLERILTLSSIKDLADKSKNDYVKELQESYTDIVSGALKSWDERSKSELRTSVDTTNLSIESSVKLYNESRKKITEIIQETIEKQVNENIEKGLDPRLPPSESQSVNVRSGNAISDTILVGTITTGGTLISASLLGIAAHTAGLLTTHLFWAINPVTGAVLAVTPLGWGVALGALGFGVWMGAKVRTDKIENFKKDIINQFQQDLEKYTKDEEIEKIKKMIESIAKSAFSPLIEKQQTMLSNAKSIRDSLNNQKIQLENGKINYEEEESRLINLGQKLSIQLQEIVEEYNKYFPSVQEKTTRQEV